jgi:3-methyladenine DNA glycosylase Mpg
VTDHADEALRYVRMYRPGLITMTCTPQGLPAGTLVRAIRRTSGLSI